MADRANLRFGPYPSQRPARGTAYGSDIQSHRGGLRNRNHLVGDSFLPVPPNMFFQQGSQAPIFNGPIAGGVNHYHASSIDALRILYDYSAMGAMHDSNERFPPPLCHPGTREAALVRIMDWYGYKRGPGKPIMWVHAPAGYGKTAIAGTISKMLKETVGLDFSPLGATFFFWRTSLERNNPTRFIVTIAAQLAISIPKLNPHIADAVIRNPLILRKALEVQLVELIIEPFRALGDLEDIPTRLVIIDGLDECINSEQESRVERKYAEDQEQVQVRVLNLIHTLQSHQLPLSFLILSRPEAWIRQHIESRLFKNAVKILDLYKVGDHLYDVEKYVRAELSRIAENIGDKSGWPGEGVVQRFVRKTNGHILYASTAIRYIDDPYDDPRERLKNVLDSSSDPDLAHFTPFSSLYELYRQILRSCPNTNRSLMIQVLEEIVVTSVYFNVNIDLSRALAILDPLSGRAAGGGARAIRNLHAVLRLVNDKDPDPSNPFIHSSFVEFLTNHTLALEFAVDKKEASRRLLWNCLERMSAGLTDSSKIQEAHLRFSIRIFRLLWAAGWSSEDDVRLHQGEYVRVVERLLTVNLTTCIVELFGFHDPVFHFDSPDLLVTKFVGSLERLPKESDPLAQQAIIHVLSSTDRAIAYLCKQSMHSMLLADLETYLKVLYQRSTDSDRRKSEEVVQALESLRVDLEKVSCSLGDSPESPPKLGWSSYIRPILDYTRQDDAFVVTEIDGVGAVGTAPPTGWAERQPSSRTPSPQPVPVSDWSNSATSSEKIIIRQRELTAHFFGTSYHSAISSAPSIPEY